jgi:hypothetical protein
MATLYKAKKELNVVRISLQGTEKEDDSCAAAQELPNILWNKKIHYLAHKSLSMVHS